ncbi:MAG: S41 family peptidase [Ktedonobacterales bacterium]
MTPFEEDNQSEASNQSASSNSAMPATQGVAQVAITAVLVAVAFAAGWFGNGYANQQNTATGNQRLVLQAWNAIDQNFVVTSAINQKAMAYAAIDAMVGTLGDTGHSRFETPEEFQQEQQDLQDQSTVGIGVYISGGGSQPLTIDGVIPGSPAAKSGKLRPGDEIVGVNGKSIQGMTIDQSHTLIDGKAGTTVTLTLLRPSVSTTSTFEVTLTREPFTAPTTVSYIIPGLNIAHIQLTQFSEDADSSLRAKLKQALAEHVSGIILDLRGNPGGYLDQAQAVASEFISAGKGKNVLIEKTRTSEQPVPVLPGGVATNVPLVILVDNNTASAAEITAGAIGQLRPDVKLVGETTFGTGTILSTFLLSDGSALVLGTDEWLLPNGESTYHHGIVPDQKVALPSNVIAVSPLVASEEKLTLQQIKASGDTQLLQAIKDLSGQ